MKRLVTSVAAIGLLAGAGMAQACTLGAWTSTNGAVTDGGIGDTPVYSRISGRCSMQADADGSVRTTEFLDEAVTIQRFYFYANGSGTATIYQAYSDAAATTPVYSLTFDGTNVNYVSADGGTNASAAVNGTTDWHAVELAWTANGAVDMWVDVDSSGPASASGTSGAASVVAAVELGAIGGTGGFNRIGFDDYVSRRSSAIGLLVPGDAASPMDGNVDVTDLQAIINEILGAGEATGMPNCNLDDTVATDVQDLQCVVNDILGL